MSDLVHIAVQGLTSMYLYGSDEFVQTVRGFPGLDGPYLVPEGTNLRYAAIVALGLNRADESCQREVLAGLTARDLSHAISQQAVGHPDPGAIALTAWAAAEVDGRFDGRLFERLQSWLGDASSKPTVDVAWVLSAALAARDLGETKQLVSMARTRLLAEQGSSGIFPHALPATSQGRFREHVGCFADQVYPIQALARLASAKRDGPALLAANRCAARICALQGPSGQWWWHYDARGGSVIEPYPVYSVHQHAMAPMALFDLVEAGGDDHTPAIRLGLRWLDTHPEVLSDLVVPRRGVIWRKVGRREPRKAVRILNAVTTSARPGMRLPGLDRIFPAGVVDYECRPYELGWLLYAWSGRPEPTAVEAGSGTAHAPSIPVSSANGRPL